MGQLKKYSTSRKPLDKYISDLHAYVYDLENENEKLKKTNIHKVFINNQTNKDRALNTKITMLKKSHDRNELVLMKEINRLHSELIQAKWLIDCYQKGKMYL